MSGVVSESVRAMETGVVLIVGTGRTGKTVTLWNLLERELKDRSKAFMRYPPGLLADREDCRSVESISEVRPGDVYVCDDAALTLLSRGFDRESAKAFARWLTVVSHKDIVAIFTIQAVRLLDVVVLEPQSILVLQKWIDWEVLRMERPEFASSFVLGNAMLGARYEQAGLEGPARKALAWCGRYGEFYESSLPSWWSDRYSKPYRDVGVETWK